MRSILQAFFLFSTWRQITVDASELPKVAPIKDDQKIVFASIGTALSIRCPVDLQNSKEIYVDWTKEGDSLYLVDGYTMNDKGVLRIKNITESNKGQYTCSAINGHGSVSVSFLLIIVDKRTGDAEKNLNRSSMYSKTSSTNGHEVIPSIKKTQMKVFREEAGESLKIACSATGYPAPNIFWLKDGKLISDLEMENKITRRQTHSVITLKKLLNSDAGSYKCIAKNSAGEDQMDYTLQVFEPLLPPEILSLKPKNLTVFNGHSVSFRCEGRNIPSLKLHVKWLKIITEEVNTWNRTFRLASNNYRVLDTSQEPMVTKSGLFHSELFIPNATSVDSGTYVCLAVNDKGYKYKNATLKVFQPGIIMSLSPREPTASVSFLMFIVFSTAVVLTPLIFVMFIYCKCQQTENTRNLSIENHSFTIADRTFNTQIKVEEPSIYSTS